MWIAVAEARIVDTVKLQAVRIGPGGQGSSPLLCLSLSGNEQADGRNNEKRIRRNWLKRNSSMKGAWILSFWLDGLSTVAIERVTSS